MCQLVTQGGYEQSAIRGEVEGCNATSVSFTYKPSGRNPSQNTASRLMYCERMVTVLALAPYFPKKRERTAKEKVQGWIIP